jgi:hypothetical protein
MMEKIYRVQMNNNGAPNFATAEEMSDRPQEWIPCSERLPANDDQVIISILDESGDIPYRYSYFGWYFDRAKCWIVESEPRTDVVAWMPLPKPWKGTRGQI